MMIVEKKKMVGGQEKDVRSTRRSVVNKKMCGGHKVTTHLFAQRIDGCNGL